MIIDKLQPHWEMCRAYRKNNKDRAAVSFFTRLKSRRKTPLEVKALSYMPDLPVVMFDFTLQPEVHK